VPGIIGSLASIRNRVTLSESSYQKKAMSEAVYMPHSDHTPQKSMQIQT
jgi:hypothetical protein